jgi:hypothetical protein
VTLAIRKRDVEIGVIVVPGQDLDIDHRVVVGVDHQHVDGLRDSDRGGSASRQNAVPRSAAPPEEAGAVAWNREPIGRLIQRECNLPARVGRSGGLQDAVQLRIDARPA